MGQAFKFRLKTVRRLRQQELDARRRDVAEATREVVALQRRLTDLGETARANVAEIRAAQEPPAALDVPQIRMHYVHQGYLGRQLVDAELRLAKQQRELATRRGRLQEANAKAKAIEKLYERQKQRFDEAERRTEQKTADDQALRTFTHKRSSGISAFSSGNHLGRD